MSANDLEGVKETLYKIFNNSVSTYRGVLSRGYDGFSEGKTIAEIGEAIAKVERELRESKGLATSKLPKAANG